MEIHYSQYEINLGYDNKNVQDRNEALSSKFVSVLHSSVHPFLRIAFLIVSQVDRIWMVDNLVV